MTGTSERGRWALDYRDEMSALPAVGWLLECQKESVITCDGSVNYHQVNVTDESEAVPPSFTSSFPPTFQLKSKSTSPGFSPLSCLFRIGKPQAWVLFGLQEERHSGHS